MLWCLKACHIRRVMTWLDEWLWHTHVRRHATLSLHRFGSLVKHRRRRSRVRTVLSFSTSISFGWNIQSPSIKFVCFFFPTSFACLVSINNFFNNCLGSLWFYLDQLSGTLHSPCSSFHGSHTADVWKPIVSSFLMHVPTFFHVWERLTCESRRKEPKSQNKGCFLLNLTTNSHHGLLSPTQLLSCQSFPKQ